MKKLAQRLAGQVAVRPVQTVQAAPKPAPKPEPKKPQWSEKSSKTMKWDEAIYYCDNLSEGGHSDWRLPNIEELKTFLSKQNSDSGYFFWSSTPHLMVNHTAWRVGFDIVDKTLHYSNYPKSDKYYVRCVRKAE